MTTIFVENCLENGAVIQIVERFGGCAIHRSLKPGENARITLSRYKSIVVEPASTNALPVDLAGVWAGDPAGDTWPNFLQRRCG
jgi:hypothetical protein